MAGRHLIWAALLGVLPLAGVAAEPLRVEPAPIVEWKSVYGQVETRDRVPARARIGGVVTELLVTEGDRVAAGQRIARVEDDKLAFQRGALDAQLAAARAQRDSYRADLERGRQLVERGVITSQRMEQLQTAVEVTEGQIRSLEAERLVVEQQIAEGDILAPDAGIVLSVPLARGSVVTPGEAAAEIGGGGVFLRLSVPERHAADLSEGDAIEIGTAPGGPPATGRLARIYPLIEGGRVQADVEVEGLDDRFVGRRLVVRLPVATRMALLVPEAALSRAGGLDLVAVQSEGGTSQRVVVPGATVMRDGAAWREILTGLAAGDLVVTGDD